MFTGIIEELGTVASLESRSAGARLVIECHTVLSDATEGSSIAVNGVCLTALELTPNSFAADLAPETLSRTNLGDLGPGARVNLERPVTPVTRLSGHIVQGHVDATGVLIALDELGDGNWWLKLLVPEGLDRYMVHKGSIAIDGISLTIAALDPGLHHRRHHHPAHLHAHHAKPSPARNAPERRSGCARQARRKSCLLEPRRTPSSRP